MITLKNVTLRRGAKVLLDSASVTLNPGEKVGLVGRNGAGKSTLFGLLNGTLHEDAGDYYGYRNGQFNLRKFVVQSKRGSFKIFQTVSGNFEAPYTHFKIVLHGIPDHISEYEVDGRMYKITRRNNLLGVVKFRTISAFKEISLKL